MNKGTLIRTNVIMNNFETKKVYARQMLNHRSEQINYGMVSQYHNNKKSELNKLCDIYGSDKGGDDGLPKPYAWPSHTYVEMYDLMFRLHKNDVSLLIECGIGHFDQNSEVAMSQTYEAGASLRIWRDYFPNARIIGVDIRRDILFSDERIDTYHCDQTEPESIEKFVLKAGLCKNSVDIIIDDGLHTFLAGKTFFEEMIKYLDNNGIYIIEDILPSDMILYKDYFLNLTDKYLVNFMNLTSPTRGLLRGDNRMLMIRKNL